MRLTSHDRGLYLLSIQSQKGCNVCSFCGQNILTYTLPCGSASHSDIPQQSRRGATGQEGSSDTEISAPDAGFQNIGKRAIVTISLLSPLSAPSIQDNNNIFYTCVRKVTSVAIGITFLSDLLSCVCHRNNFIDTKVTIFSKYWNSRQDREVNTCLESIQ